MQPPTKNEHILMGIIIGYAMAKLPLKDIMGKFFKNFKPEDIKQIIEMFQNQNKTGPKKRK